MGLAHTQEITQACKCQQVGILEATCHSYIQAQNSKFYIQTWPSQAIEVVITKGEE